jgi:hypothetical protein
MGCSVSFIQNVQAISPSLSSARVSDAIIASSSAGITNMGLDSGVEIHMPWGELGVIV